MLRLREGRSSEHQVITDAGGTTRISENRIGASKPKRRIGCKVISAARSSAGRLFVLNHYKQRCYGMEVGLPPAPLNFIKVIPMSPLARRL